MQPVRVWQTSIECLYIIWFYLAPCTLFLLFLLYLAAIINCDFWDVCPPEFIQEDFRLLSHNFPSPFQLPLLCPFSSPLSPLLLKTLTMVVSPLFHFPASLPTTLSQSVVAILHLRFLTHGRVSFFWFLHFRHGAYRCSNVCTVAPHHQHSGVSTTPIRTRKVPTATCPTFI